MKAMGQPSRPLRLRTAVLGPFLALVFGSLAAPARAGGGNVLPATATPHGYSLSDMAAVAHFNASDHTGAEPDVPFQILYTNGGNAFTVRTGTMFYVPIIYVDDSPPPPPGDFPGDVTDQAKAVEYFFDSKQLGAQSIEILVDRSATTVGPDYVVGVELAEPLPDGGGISTSRPLLSSRPSPKARIRSNCGACSPERR
jgi:hypothetical protein